MKTNGLTANAQDSEAVKKRGATTERGRGKRRQKTRTAADANRSPCPLKKSVGGRASLDGTTKPETAYRRFRAR